MTPRRVSELSGFRKVVVALALSICTVPWLAGAASADVGGQQLSPGNCPYPEVGPFGFDGVAEHYACHGPTEINGAARWCLFGGAATTVVGAATFPFFTIGFQQPVGVLEGLCYWACPDGQAADEPNPIGTWQGSSSSTEPVKRHKCKPVGPNPFANRAPAQPEPDAAPPVAPPPQPEILPPPPGEPSRIPPGPERSQNPPGVLKP